MSNNTFKFKEMYSKSVMKLKIAESFFYFAEAVRHVVMELKILSLNIWYTVKIFLIYFDFRAY